MSFSTELLGPQSPSEVPCTAGPACGSHHKACGHGGKIHLSSLTETKHRLCLLFIVDPFQQGSKQAPGTWMAAQTETAVLPTKGEDRGGHLLVSGRSRPASSAPLLLGLSNASLSVLTAEGKPAWGAQGSRPVCLLHSRNSRLGHRCAAWRGPGWTSRSLSRREGRKNKAWWRVCGGGRRNPSVCDPAEGGERKRRGSHGILSTRSMPQAVLATQRTPGQR